MTRNQDRNREPCPDRIIDDIGGAFAMGTLGGSMWHFLKGTYNASKGHRFHHGFQTMRMKVPALGSGFAAWGGVFSISDCSLVYLRQKEDPWNSIIAGATTGGFLSMRQGLGAASKSAAFGAVLLAMIEGGQIMVEKWFSQANYMPPLMETDFNNISGLPPMMPGQGPNMGEISQPSSWFGGLFGGNKENKKKESSSSGSKSEMLESFDAPRPPTFEFK